MTDRLACRIRATWTEGDVPAFAGFRPTAAAVAAGAEDVSLTLMRFALSQKPMSPEQREVIHFARSQGLPSVHDPDGVSFGQTEAVHLEHKGIEIGRVAVTRGAANRFDALGWIHPDYGDAAREAGHVSPGLWTIGAEIATFGGVDVLHVTDSDFIELSVVKSSAKVSSLEVSQPKQVPAEDWPLLLTSGSAFEPPPEEFSEEIEGPFRIAFPATVTAF